MFYCPECGTQMDARLIVSDEKKKIYIDTTCPKCGVMYTGTMKKLYGPGMK